MCQSRRPKSKGTVENLAKLCDRLLSYNNEFETLNDLIEIVNKFNEECGKEKSQAHNKIVNDVFEEEKTPSEIVKEKGMEQVSDEAAIRDMVNEVIDENPNQLATYKSGKTNILGFFVGQVLKKSGGKANPSIVNKIVNEEINKR